MDIKGRITRVAVGILALTVMLAIAGCGRVATTGDQPHATTPEAGSVEASATE